MARLFRPGHHQIPASRQAGPTLSFTNPKAEAERLALDTTENMVADGLVLAQKGRLVEALTVFTDVQALQVDYQISAEA
jgi:hypothetical protein